MSRSVMLPGRTVVMRVQIGCNVDAVDRTPVSVTMDVHGIDMEGTGGGGLWSCSGVWYNVYIISGQCTASVALHSRQSSRFRYQ